MNALAFKLEEASTVEGDTEVKARMAQTILNTIATKGKWHVADLMSEFSLDDLARYLPEVCEQVEVLSVENLIRGS
jgi:hypothetical protein